MKLSVVIPVYLSDPLHLSFTEETLASLESKEHELEILVVVNYADDRFRTFLKQLSLSKEIRVIENPLGNHLAASWNLGIKKGFEAGTEYVLVINNDLVFQPEAIDNLVEFAQKQPELLLWSASEWPELKTIKTAKLNGEISFHPHFSAFMVDRKTIKKVGYFDENLGPAYFEDNDYHTRILLAGGKAASTKKARFYHYGSRTTRVDHNLKRQTYHSYKKNREYLLKKWGVDFHGRVFEPPEEVLELVYQQPFNNPRKKIKDW